MNKARQKGNERPVVSTKRNPQQRDAAMADLAATAAAFGIPSLGVWKSYLILPKFFAVPSMIASSFLARDVVRKRRENGAIPLNNGVLLGLAVVNVVGSFFG